MDKDFKSASEIIRNTCGELKFHYRLMDQERPKIVVRNQANQEIFSLIPAYQENNLVIFKYPIKYGGDEHYPVNLLERVGRCVDGYNFISPTNEFIKAKFEWHMRSRPEKLKLDAYKKDAEALGLPK